MFRCVNPPPFDFHFFEAPRAFAVGSVIGVFSFLFCVSLSGTFERYIARLALDYVAPGYASHTASSRFVPRFSVRVVLACFSCFRVSLVSNYLLSDTQCPRVIGYSLAS